MFSSFSFSYSKKYSLPLLTIPISILKETALEYHKKMIEIKVQICFITKKREVLDLSYWSMERNTSDKKIDKRMACP